MPQMKLLQGEPSTRQEHSISKETHIQKFNCQLKAKHIRRWKTPQKKAQRDITTPASHETPCWLQPPHGGLVSPRHWGHLKSLTDLSLSWHMTEVSKPWVSYILVQTAYQESCPANALATQCALACPIRLTPDELELTQPGEEKAIASPWHKSMGDISSRAAWTLRSHILIPK